MNLARYFRVPTLELQGGSVINAGVEEFLLRQGALSKTINAPDILGGGKQDVFFKIFEVK